MLEGAAAGVQLIGAFDVEADDPEALAQRRERERKPT